MMNRRNVLTALILPSLTACGGGGDGDRPSLSETQAQFSGTLSDAAGVPLQDADVFIPINGAVYQTKTDSSGRYRITVDISRFADLGLFALRAYKDGYQPYAAYYNAPLSPKTIYTLSSGPSVALVALGPNEYSSIAFADIVHLGDNNFGGSANSQLQTASRGTAFASTVFNWKTADDGKFKTASAKLQIRGLEGATQTVKGMAWLADATGKMIGVQSVLGFDSDPSGGYSILSLNFSLPATIPAGAVQFVLQTGQRVGDYDDIEYTGISVQLVP